MSLISLHSFTAFAGFLGLAPLVHSHSFSPARSLLLLHPDWFTPSHSAPLVRSHWFSPTSSLRLIQLYFFAPKHSISCFKFNGSAPSIHSHWFTPTHSLLFSAPNLLLIGLALFIHSHRFSPVRSLSLIHSTRLSSLIHSHRFGPACLLLLTLVSSRCDLHSELKLTAHVVRRQTATQSIAYRLIPGSNTHTQTHHMWATAIYRNI